MAAYTDNYNNFSAHTLEYAKDELIKILYLFFSLQHK